MKGAIEDLNARTPFATFCSRSGRIGGTCDVRYSLQTNLESVLDKYLESAIPK
jgi:hypothetical protein